MFFYNIHGLLLTMIIMNTILFEDINCMLIIHSSFMEHLKGKSVLMIFDKHTNLKYKLGNRHFWSEGYYVSTVGLNEVTVKNIYASKSYMTK